jgi:hypothetical protein
MPKVDIMSTFPDSNPSQTLVPDALNAPPLGEQFDQSPREGWRRGFLKVALAAIGAACLMLLLISQSGLVKDTFLRFNGNVLVVDEPIRNIVSRGHEDTKQVRFTIRNVSANDATIFGITSDCGCAMGETGLPLIVPGNSERELVFVIHPRKSDRGRQQIRIQPRTNVPLSPAFLSVSLDIVE